MITKFPGQEHVYRSFDSLQESDHILPEEFLSTLTPSGLPPHSLSLKEKCPIMLLRNMDPYKGHCNGTKYIIDRLHTRIIEATIASGTYKGNKIFIPRIPMSPSEKTFPFTLQPGDYYDV